MLAGSIVLLLIGSYLIKRITEIEI